MGRAGGRRTPRERCGLHPPELYTLQFSQAGTRPLTVPEYFRMNHIHLWCVHFFLKIFIYLFQLEANYFTILWWVLPYIDIDQPWVYPPCVPHSEPHSHLPPCPFPLGCPSAPALGALFHASTLDWWSSSHMAIYMFQCCSLKSSHPRLLPESKSLFLHLCLLRCLAYSIIITAFLNSMHMC